MKLDFDKITNIKIENINKNDYPDFVDAFISYAEINGESLTDEELDIVNENEDFVYKSVLNYLY
jgi:hypothetical protein